jgi:hypothetical protein
MSRPTTPPTGLRVYLLHQTRFSRRPQRYFESRWDPRKRGLDKDQLAFLKLYGKPPTGLELNQFLRSR